MKSKITMLFIAFAFTLSTSFANDGHTEVPSAINHNFSSHFVGAKNISWNKVGGLYQANFEIDGANLFAFFSSDAHFIGVMHNILSDRLPLLLQADLKTNYQGYWITNLCEYAMHHEPGYRITLENADQKIILKSDNLSDWQLLETINKD
ncbi:MAG: hypothetical protein JST58_14920 [Bacteroidetes bacterium]|nr:hypothetical protein [Bacteroidota bacterium]